MNAKVFKTTVSLRVNPHLPWGRAGVQIRTSVIRIISQMYASGLNPTGRATLTIPSERDQTHAEIHATDQWDLTKPNGEPVPRNYNNFDHLLNWSELCEQLTRRYHNPGTITASVSTPKSRIKWA